MPCGVLILPIHHSLLVDKYLERRCNKLNPDEIIFAPKEME
jgi:hypothetical protein